MRFKLWRYEDCGYNFFVAQDTSKRSHTPGSWLLRDQSIYPEDCGKLVWKNASHPVAVEAKAHTGEVVAEAERLIYLSAEFGR